MRQSSHSLAIASHARGLTEFTAELRRFVADSGIRDGLLTVYCRHTSASLIIQENADPDVCADLQAFLSRLVPEGDPLYRHVIEGADDMPAHVRAALTQTSLTIPVASGRLALGTWQGVFLWEHRSRDHRREILVHLIGE